MKEKKPFNFCESLKMSLEEFDDNDIYEKHWKDMNELRTIALDDTDIRVHCTSNKAADNIEKTGTIKGNPFSGVSFTNKIGGFKGHTCNSGADTCFVFSKKDIDTNPVIYEWNPPKVADARNILRGICPAGGWNSKTECE